MKRLLHNTLAAFGFELRRKTDQGTLAGLLNQMNRYEVAPQTVLDIGAARGDFTRQCMASFPDASFVMVEPLSEFAGQLSHLAASHPKTLFVSALAASRPGEAAINVHPDLMGSSIYTERESDWVNGDRRQVAATTVDEIVSAHALFAPLFIKVDTQGAEIDVLNGAAKALPNACCVVLETSFFQFFDGAPLVADVVSFMSKAGLVPYDIVGISRRPLDGALAQIDLAFVPSQSPLRSDHHFATAEQRQALTRRLLGNRR